MRLDARKWWRGAVQWVPFAARTVAYGALSCAVGPLSPRRAVSTWCMHRWCVTATRALGISVEADGLEHLPRKGRATVIVSNHQSTLDIIVLGSVLGLDYKWAAKRELFKVPFLGWHLAISGHIPVDRGRKEAAARLARAFDRVLANGASLLVFPEGTRSPDGAMREFRTGAFLAAARAGVPVVPIVLDGTYPMMSKDDPMIADGVPRVVKLRVLPPIEPAEVADVELRARTARLRRIAHERMAAGMLAIGGRVARPRREARSNGHETTEPG